MHFLGEGFVWQVSMNDVFGLGGGAIVVEDDEDTHKRKTVCMPQCSGRIKMG